MYRRSILVLVGVLAMAAVLAIPAGAGSARRTSTTQKVYKNFKCKSHVNRYDPRTWACTIVTVDPWQAVSGDTTTVTYVFKAKTTLKHVLVCFSTIEVTGKLSCAYHHKYLKLSKGRVIKRVVQMPVPSVTTSGGYKLDNYSRFYKRQKLTVRNLSYWLANSNVCIAMPSEPDACSGGK